MFSTGDVPHGCGHVPRTVYKGIRTTGADFVTNKNARGNITVQTDTTVDKVIFANQGEQIRASGVATKTFDGRSKIYHARKEIIISGGAYCSPAILLRSGIGPKEELAKHGIPCTMSAPGVGRNLMDHLVSQSSADYHHTMANMKIVTDRLHVLRNRKSWTHKRPPRLPRRQLRQNLLRMERKENRLSLHLPLRRLRIRQARLATSA